MQWFLSFLQRVRVWGLPYHGLARDTTLTTDVGSKTITLPHKPYTGEVVLVQHSSYQNVSDSGFFTDEEKAAHTAAGVEWREYAFLVGRNRMLGGTELYPIPDPPGSSDTPTIKKWVYCDASQAWLVGVTLDDYDDYHYDVAVYIYDRLVFAAGADRKAPTPRLLALETVTFLDSAGNNTPTSALANPCLVMTHSSNGAKSAVNVFPQNCYQENLDLYFNSPVVSNYGTTPYAEIPLVDVFGAYAALKIEITGDGDTASETLGDGITATITVDRVVYDMLSSKTAEHSYNYDEEYARFRTSDTDDLYPPPQNNADGNNYWAYSSGAGGSPSVEKIYCAGASSGSVVTSTLTTHTWSTPTAYAGRAAAGTYFGGWGASGKTYWELTAEMYLYVTPAGVYHYGVQFDGWAGYIQTITSYSSDGQEIRFTSAVWTTNIGAVVTFEGDGEVQVSKAFSYKRGSESDITVFGATFSQANTMTFSESESTTYSVATNESSPCYDDHISRTTTFSESVTTAQSGTVPDSYVYPLGAPTGRFDYPLRVGWRLAFHTPAIIDVFYYALDTYYDGTTKSQPMVYVKSVAVNGTQFDRYISGQYRRATYNPVTGAVSIAADDEQKICYV